MTTAQIIPFPSRRYRPDPDARLAQWVLEHAQAEQDRDDKLAAIRVAFAEATLAQSTTDQAIVELLRKIYDRIDAQPVSRLT